MDEEDTLFDETNPNISISLTSSKSTVKYRYIFFDFETMQDDIHKQQEDFLEYRHTPNLCVAHVVCEDCKKIDIDTNPNYLCMLCGIRNKVFKGESCVDEFCTYLFSSNMRNVIAIAHNAKAFDSQFIV